MTPTDIAVLLVIAVAVLVGFIVWLVEANEQLNRDLEAIDAHQRFAAAIVRAPEQPRGHW